MGNSKAKIALAILIAWLSNSALEAFQSDEQNSQPNIPQLIRDLESRTFVEREEATQKLVEAGSATLRPLARNLGNASPEVVYRSRKIIEQIAKSGDEPTFLKAAGILKLVMFGSLEENFDYMEMLQAEWKQGRTQIAADKLRQCGAKITLMDEIEPTPDEIFINEIRFAANSRSQRPAQVVKAKKITKLSRGEIRSAIDEILVGSIDQNRELVFGDRSSETTSPIEELNNQLNNQQVWRNRENFIRNGQLGSIGNNATFDENWNGDQRTFAQLTSIENLSELTLKNLEVTEEQIQVLQRLDLDTLELENCVLDSQHLEKLAELDSLSHFKISKQQNAIDIMKVLTELPNLRGLEIADCEFKKDDLSELAKCKKLVQVFLTGLDIPADTLREVGSLDRLRYMSMKSCSFDVEAFRALKKRRSNVTFTTVARAFLGVRGPVEFGDADFECKISEVIPGSGADKAGVLIGDVITKINDHDIEVFNDLILYISQHDIGDGLTLEVIRDGEKLKLSAELGIRDPTIQ